MQTSLQITFRRLLASPSLEARIRESVANLERFTAKLTACHVIIGTPAGRRTKGTRFTIKVELTVPGRIFCVDTGRAQNPAHQNVYIALHDAFETLRRQLHDFEHQRVAARRRCSVATAKQVPAEHSASAAGSQ
jgi:ribosome-associated translation inhibitor RaiA